MTSKPITFDEVYFLAFRKEHAELLDRVLSKFDDLQLVAEPQRT